ncbi:uncharacterized protein LOC127698172 isoform X2 [Mytilus californianus]|uniref:uncharacterized protein LOC127698172 isoform X2 n=1 Tax=Mytilus californianus TaxID=6549 RepID=UPI0022475C0A|nr:uncharacterized protein LOC127698172 isoform X2 [Mytilus californianus]
MKTGKRTTGTDRGIENEKLNSNGIDTMKNKETRSNLPAWQIRKKKASMPRPKSTGYLKDFNILSAEDDVEDDADTAYDDYVLSRQAAVGMDLAKRNGYTINEGIGESNKASYNVRKDIKDVTKDFHGNVIGYTDVHTVGDRGQQFKVNETNGRLGGADFCNDFEEKFNCGLSKTRQRRDDVVLTRDVSGRAAYWQNREDDSRKPNICSTSSGVKRNWTTPRQIRQMKDQVDPNEMTQYIYDAGVANRAAMWQKLEDDHFEKMIINPDKEWKGPKVRVVLPTDHPEYGRPPKGSKTEKRGIKAHKHVVKEIGELCLMIAENGELQDDGTVTITFRKLFQTYVAISNKVVGILIRARKRGLLHFNGEMLYQRQDEEEVIRLFNVPDLLE